MFEFHSAFRLFAQFKFRSQIGILKTFWFDSDRCVTQLTFGPPLISARFFRLGKWGSVRHWALIPEKRPLGNSGGPHNLSVSISGRQHKHGSSDRGWSPLPPSHFLPRCLDSDLLWQANCAGKQIMEVLGCNSLTVC